MPDEDEAQDDIITFCLFDQLKLESESPLKQESESVFSGDTQEKEVGVHIT